MERPGEIEAETRFLKEVWSRHLRRPVRRVLDLASGDSPHGVILAREGIQVAGVDRSPTMIAAGRRAAHSLDSIRFYRRPIEKFRLPERPFDAAFFMSETFPVMADNRALLSHLESVARLLKRGAPYCIDIDRHDDVRRLRTRKLWRSRKVRAGGLRVDVREFHRPLQWCSPMHSIYELECTIHFPEGPVRTRDLVPVRYTIPATLELAALASRQFTMAAAYADLSLTRPIEDCTGRWWAVLRRV